MTKPSSAFPISHSGLTFQQLPLRAGLTSSRRGAGVVQRGTAGLAWHSMAQHGCPGHLGTGSTVHGTACMARCGVALHLQPGTDTGLAPLAAAPFPAIIRGMKFSHSCCPDLQLQHRPDLLSTWGDPPVHPIPAPPPARPLSASVWAPQELPVREKQLVRNPKGSSGLQVGGREETCPKNTAARSPKVAEQMARLGGHLGSCRWYPGLPALCPPPRARGGQEGTGVSEEEGAGVWGCGGKAGCHRQGLCPVGAALSPRGHRARSGRCRERRGSPSTGLMCWGKGHKLQTTA